MLKKVLSVPGLFGVGFALWLSSQKSPEVLGRYALAVRYLGYAFMLFALGALVWFFFSWVKASKIRITRLTDDNHNLREQLNWKDPENASAAVNRCRSLWEGKCQHSIAVNYEDDPVYLQLLLDQNLSKIVAQPIVQRLNHIKQLSFAYLTFRSATHTRLAHSLGACRNAELVMRKVFQQGRLYSRSGEEKMELTERDKAHYLRLAMVAALVHDLGHGPLSHALEIHLGIGEEGKARVRPDKLLSIKYIDKYLRPVISEAGVDPDEVLALIRKDVDSFSPWMHFIGDLIDSPLDVDRMDYLARDSHMTGLSIGALNMQALIERVVPFKEVENDQTVKIELAFDSSAVPYIEQFLYARDVMYLNCYEHPKKVVAERMLGRAFDEFRKVLGEAARVEPEDLALLSDQQIVELMLAHSGPSTLAFRMIEHLMRGVTFEKLDEVLIQVELPGQGKLEGNALEKLPTEIRHWAEAAMAEDYGGAYLEIPAEWAKTLSRRSGCVDESQIIVTVPSWSILDNWSKEGEIRILLPELEGGYKVDHVYRISRVLKHFIPALARARLTLRIFVDPALSTPQKDRLLMEARNLFMATQVA